MATKNTPRKPKAHRKFVKLRDSGYDGPIDQDGNPVKDIDQWIKQQRRQ